MEAIDRHRDYGDWRHAPMPPTRGRVWLAFFVELAPLLSLAAFALGPGIGAGLLLVTSLASGFGWSLVGQRGMHLLVIASRLIVGTPLIFVVVWVIASVTGCRGGCEPFWWMLIALWIAYALLAPMISAGALALRWWPRTAEPLTVPTA